MFLSTSPTLSFKPQNSPPSFIRVHLFRYETAAITFPTRDKGIHHTSTKLCDILESLRVKSHIMTDPFLGFINVEFIDYSNVFWTVKETKLFTFQSPTLL
jgi:hypothetical protein